MVLAEFVKFRHALYKFVVQSVLRTLCYNHVYSNHVFTSPIQRDKGLSLSCTERPAQRLAARRGPCLNINNNIIMTIIIIIIIIIISIIISSSSIYIYITLYLYIHKHVYIYIYTNMPYIQYVCITHVTATPMIRVMKYNTIVFYIMAQYYNTHIGHTYYCISFKKCKYPSLSLSRYMSKGYSYHLDMCVYIYIYTINQYTHICVYIYIYIHTYTQRERESEICIHVDVHYVRPHVPSRRGREARAKLRAHRHLQN